MNHNAPRSSAPPDRTNKLFDAVTAAVEHDPGVGKGRGFGSSGLKVGGKLFAMLVKDELVVKLPRHRVQQLIAAGSGAQFDPGHGRLMREWVTVPPGEADQWIRLAREAREYVAPAAKP
jgi:TfoX/Sxy family transcriptional regulator of competence genes